MPKSGYLYILASKRNGTLYVGATSDLATRLEVHKYEVVDGYTRRYHVHTLVYYEMHNDIRDAIERERQIKKWRRQCKLRLIEELNPEWRDLSEELL